MRRSPWILDFDNLHDRKDLRHQLPCQECCTKSGETIDGEPKDDREPSKKGCFPAFEISMVESDPKHAKSNDTARENRDSSLPKTPQK